MAKPIAPSAPARVAPASTAFELPVGEIETPAGARGQQYRAHMRKPRESQPLAMGKRGRQRAQADEKSGAGERNERVRERIRVGPQRARQRSRRDDQPKADPAADQERGADDPADDQRAVEPREDVVRFGVVREQPPGRVVGEEPCGTVIDDEARSRRCATQRRRRWRSTRTRRARGRSCRTRRAPRPRRSPCPRPAWPPRGGANARQARWRRAVRCSGRTCGIPPVPSSGGCARAARS